MFERHDGGERAVLLHPRFLDQTDQPDLEEFAELAKAAQAEVVDVVSTTQKSVTPRYLIGKGKAEQLAEAVKANKAELILVNASLSPSQERNLEQICECRVCDRTGLILDIFAKRAQTHEGKLQVELAQLNYMSTRLVRGWTHLERQRGGRIGLTGPGETQLELDRRLLRGRIKQIKARLTKVRQQRELGRQSRQRSNTVTIALVGYTNAGKSSLFNALTDAGILVADQLFATLDPTIRQVTLPGLGQAVLADTVGFIRHLPHDLVEAFRATLEEVTLADLLLHVIDASDPEYREHNEQVLQVLAQLGADRIPRIEVYNKIDLLDAVKPHAETLAHEGLRVWVSVAQQQGLRILKQSMADALMAHRIQATITLPSKYGKLRAALYAQQAVQNETVLETGAMELIIDINRSLLQQLCRESGLTIEDVL